MEFVPQAISEDIHSQAPPFVRRDSNHISSQVLGLLQFASSQPPSAPSAAAETLHHPWQHTLICGRGLRTGRTALGWSCFLYKLTLCMVRKKFFLAGITFEYTSFTSNGQQLWEQRHDCDPLNPLPVLCQHKRQPVDTCGKESTAALMCDWTMPKRLIMWITINCGKFFKRWDYQTTWPASWEICMQVRKQQLELDMEQQTGSK